LITAKTAAETISEMLEVFGRIHPHLRRSITFDNDTAFGQHRLLRTMGDMTTWFCDAYASWQKGGVENANARLRRWLRTIPVVSSPIIARRRLALQPAAAVFFGERTELRFVISHSRLGL
jgi:hypothetical protein